MALYSCPDCGHKVSDTAPACPGCGRPMYEQAPPAPVVVVQKPKTGCGTAGCAVILVLFLFGWLMSLCTSRQSSIGSTTGQPASNPLTPEQRTAAARASEQARVAGLPAAIEQAKGVASDAKKCGDKNQVSAAWIGLKRVQKTDKEWAEATTLVGPLESCRGKIERQAVADAQVVRSTLRKAWASEIRKICLDNSMDINWAVGGPGNTRVTASWILMGNVAVHKLTKNGSMASGAVLAQAQELGFKRVTFTDGRGFSVYYDLEPAADTQAGKLLLAPLGLAQPLKLE